MNFQEAVNYIESLTPTLVRPGLERFALFMSEQGQLQDRCSSLHVAGTNGKGSTVSMLAHTLNTAGLKAGKYTGPHLFSFCERYEVQGKQISALDFSEICSRLKEQSEDFGVRHPQLGPLTWFEILTAIAFVYFEKANTEVSVFEVGLGGRFDATNVLTRPLSTAIVTVGLDHMHLLGQDKKDIAAEKAGIIKEGVPVVTACRNEALDIIRREALKKNAPVICTDAGSRISCGTGSNQERTLLEALKKRFAGLKVPLARTLARQPGYQRVNAAVAAATLGLFELASGRQCLDGFDEALSSYFWPGRLQYFQRYGLILDGAHNTDGARALRASLDELFPSKACCFVLCFYQSKQFKEFMAALLRPGDLVFASQTTGRRPVVPSCEIVMTARSLACQAQSFEILDEAFKASSQLDRQTFIQVGCGSFASVVAGLKYLGYDNTEDSQSDSTNLWQPA
jgi:dihydrofolate synthase / folylpolyglutamate synthase